MKFILIAAISILSTLASGLALPDLTPRATVIRPEIAAVIKEDFPRTPYPGIIAEVSRRNGAHEVRTLLGFAVPACTGFCKFSFTDAITATGSRTVQLFTTIGYPTKESTWESRPPTNFHIGTFLVNIPGPADVLEDFGLRFPCPATATKYGYEVKPVNDNISVTWDITKGGFIITCD